MEMKSEIVQLQQDLFDVDLLTEVLRKVLMTVIYTFVVFGGALPYVFQYREIQRTQNARGFSLFVCLALLAANILRILFWFGRRFEAQLLLQSVSMLICMMCMVHVAVKVNAKHILPPHHHPHSLWDGDLVEHFWCWTDFSSYLMTVLAFTAVGCGITRLFIESRLFVECLGFLSLFLEGNLGTPQLLNNWKRHSTVGMSVRMVLLWLLGDVSKTVYFVARQTPIQFWLCGMFQIGVDIAILTQVLLYRDSDHHKLDDSSSMLD